MKIMKAEKVTVGGRVGRKGKRKKTWAEKKSG